MRAGHNQPANTYCNNSVIFRQSLARWFVALREARKPQCVLCLNFQELACARATNGLPGSNDRIRQAWNVRSAALARSSELTEFLAEEPRPLNDLRSSKMIQTTWRDFYRAAILEIDRSLLKVRVQAAEDSINARASDARASRQERREMTDALWTLQRLKRVDRRLVPNGVESARVSH
jgi:hypothetical protein